MEFVFVRVGDIEYMYCVKSNGASFLFSFRMDYN